MDRDKIAIFFKEFMNENNVVTVKRDMDYLRWRFLSNPVVPHQITVTESEDKITSMTVFSLKSMKGGIVAGNLVDVVAIKDKMHHLDICLASSIRDIDEAGAAYVETWMNDSDIFDRIRPHLRKQGFVPIPRRFYGQGLDLIYKSFGPSTDAEMLKNPRNWYITMAFTEGTS
jgi:hypothetical protein